MELLSGKSLKISGNSTSIEMTLDSIDEMLVRLPEIPELEKYRKAASAYRSELEFNQNNHKDDLYRRVLELNASISLLGMLGREFPIEFEDESQTQNKQEKPKYHQTKDAVVSRELVELRVTTLINMLDECNMLNENESKNKIDMVINEFSKLQFCSKEFDQKIAEAQFELMKKYVKVGKDKEAIEYAKRFSSDMKIYAYERLKKQASILEKEERIEEYNILNEYLINNKLNPNDLDFWKMVMRIERTEIERKAQIKKIENEKENKGKTFKKVKIQYDRKSDSGLSEEQIPRIQKCRVCEKNLKPYINHARRGGKIKLIIEDGITKLPYCDYQHYNDEKLLTQAILEVKLPKTLSDIGSGFFGCFKLDTIDLTETKVESIGLCTFYNAEVNNIFCPNHLKSIRYNAFYNSRVKEMDLSGTQLERVESHSFERIQIPKLKFPKTLVSIEDNAFSHSQIKEFDLSDADIKDINVSTFAGAEILDLKLPRTIETVHNDAFCNAKIVQVKMYEALKNIGNYAFFSSKIGRIDLEESMVEDLSNATFLNAESSQVILSNKTKNMGAYCFAYAKIKELDLSNTELENIGIGAFAFGKFSKVKFPKTVEKLDNEIFEGAEIEELDLSETKLENIDYKFLESFGHLKKVVLPKELEDKQKEIQEWLDKKQWDSKEKSKNQISIGEIQLIINTRKNLNFNH